MAIRRYNRGKISKPSDEELYEAYALKRGDSLAALSKSFTGDARNYREIARQNGISDANKIYEGDIIYIPKSMIKGQSSTSQGSNGIMPMSALKSPNANDYVKRQNPDPDRDIKDSSFDEESFEKATSDYVDRAVAEENANKTASTIRSAASRNVRSTKTAQPRTTSTAQSPQKTNYSRGGNVQSASKSKQQTSTKSVVSTNNTKTSAQTKNATTGNTTSQPPTVQKQNVRKSDNRPQGYSKNAWGYMWDSLTGNVKNKTNNTKEPVKKTNTQSGNRSQGQGYSNDAWSYIWDSITGNVKSKDKKKQAQKKTTKTSSSINRKSSSGNGPYGREGRMMAMPTVKRKPMQAS